MSYLKLTDTSGPQVAESSGGPLRLGRDPDGSVVVRGDAARVVSVRHAELRLEQGAWLLADLGSKNGTYLNNKRLSAPTSVKPGDVIRLGESGPEYRVAPIAAELTATLAEHPGLPMPPKEAEHRAYGITLLVTATGKRFEARGTRIRLSRGRECEVQPVDANDTTVSRVHAELTVGAGGGLVVRDAESKNGTYLNGERIAKPMPVRLGDKIMLGQGGPVLLVEGMGTAPQKAVPRPPDGAPLGQKTVIGMIGDALARAKDERKRGGRGTTAFMKAVREDVGKDARRKIRWLTGLLVILVLLLGGGVFGVYWLLSRQVEHTKQALRTAEDSSRAEGERLRRELEAARAAAAPAAEVETLRVKLVKMRAIRATDFAGLAQQNQGAVGLITVALGGDRFDSTGFGISPDGYMLTNWHVVADSAHAEPDTVWVTMADESSSRYADVVATSRERDLALIKVRGYQGSYLTAIDWAGTKARQGEPAALIGYPAGSGFARDRTSIVRTSMTAGILSRVTADLVQFDGMTTGGSSGSPVFNADGEVISVHRAGLRQGPGFALSVPVKYAIPLMPPALRQRLGV
ncbi:MAG: hypothetical protein DMD59_05435 [Gemmatimonadetes bacterium]|nr:MAG: hypothetical protein DMD59_05435 [Gemmatimonadota bacterium]